MCFLYRKNRFFHFASTNSTGNLKKVIKSQKSTLDFAQNSLVSRIPKPGWVVYALLNLDY
jgi:hypothetical protein